MKKRTTIFVLLFFTAIVVIIGRMMLVYDKTSVEFAYKDVKTTISGEGKTMPQPSKPVQPDTQTATKDSEDINHPTIMSNPVGPLKISTGDQSVVLVGNNGPISIQNDHAQKH